MILNKKKNLLVILGPTAVGKTDLALSVAKNFHSPVLSCDSRQIYRGIPIGTSAPSREQMRAVKHYFIGCKDLSEYYSASMYEEDVLQLLQVLFEKSDTIVMSGGSMMYIDAVCKGIDEIPTIDPELRHDLLLLYEREGIDPIRAQLKMLDPVFYRKTDLKNHKRVLHALEVCLMAGRPYSSLRTGRPKDRPFHIVKIGLKREREVLYRRINTRVDEMIDKGLLEEARNVYGMRNFNSLNTVGYKELFDYFDGKTDLSFAIEKIKQHTRIYARKQMTWFERDKEIVWLDPDEKEKVLSYIDWCVEKNRKQNA